MGKDEGVLAEQSDDDGSGSSKEIKDEGTKLKTEDKRTVKKDNASTPKMGTAVSKEPSEKKGNADDIRKIIKLGTKEEQTEDGNKPPDKKSQKDVQLDSLGKTPRETLEQKRAILQSIKDFDFQIKKNQEEIGGLNQKLEAVFKDLDDLVSLYEIVSEQMNPFVGLSKVTKKRIDALENFTNEIDTLKERTAELESFAERSGAKLKTLKGQNKAPVKTINTDAILARTSKEWAINPIDNKTLEQLSNSELDKLIEKSLNALSLDDKIDIFVDEFIESLKG